MRKYFVRIIAFAVLAAFLLESAALAAGTEAEPELPAAETVEEGTEEIFSEEQGEAADIEDNLEPIIIECEPFSWVEEVDESDVPVILMDAASWQPEWTCYGDQLTGMAKSLYNDMELQFESSRVNYEQQADGNFSAMFFYSFSFSVSGSTVEQVKASVSSKFDEEFSSRKEDLNRAAYAFTYDHPEYFWIRTSLLISRGSNGYSITGPQNGPFTATVPGYLSVGFSIDKAYTAAERASKTAAVNSAVDTILAQCSGKSTVAKLAYFDNWLAEKNNYNNSAAAGTPETIGPAPWNILSGLLDGTSPVCEGYAKSFQLLCHRIGVPCVTVSSSWINSSGQKEGHMWNAVQVGGKWYYVDVTWNDPSGVNYAYSTREYFLITSFSDNSHSVSQELATPPIASSGYFAASGWSLANQTVSGYKIGGGNGSHWMALYAGGGKMLEVKPCESIRWGASGTRILPLEFSFGALSQAVSGKAFQVNAWTPSGTADAFTNN